jgi:hypothetical protein
VSGHTPGPWRYQENSDAYTHIVRAGDRFLCQLAQDTSGEAEANARLLAAAPALADALGFLCEVVRGIPAASMPPEIYPRVIEGLDDARAALRAARRGEC